MALLGTRTVPVHDFDKQLAAGFLHNLAAPLRAGDAASLLVAASEAESVKLAIPAKAVYSILDTCKQLRKTSQTTQWSLLNHAAAKRAPREGICRSNGDEDV